MKEKSKERESRESFRQKMDSIMNSERIGCNVIFALMIVVPVAFIVLLITSCGPTKIQRIQSSGMTAQLGLPQESSVWEMHYDEIEHPDTLIVQDDSGKDMIIMKAVRDEDGEMVATDVINAAVVEARFRNVAERHGMVDIAFRVRVPRDMQDQNWQLRFRPRMYIMDDTLHLDSVVITGASYRKAQLKGYQQYEKFLSTIISDTTRFINMNQLELFIKRNIPDLYNLRSDSTYLSDEAFRGLLDARVATRYSSQFGVTGYDAIIHYTNTISKSRNARRDARRDKMYRKYVKVPIDMTGLRLDTVITDINGDFVYDYVQTIATRPKLRKVDVTLTGAIYEQEKLLYSIPPTEPLTYYISSLSAFVDNTPRYRKEITSRRVEANTACYIDFESAKSEIDETLSHNAEEMLRIKRNLSSLIQNREFDLDSIVVTASCSPEGTLRFNARLSQMRSESVSRYFRQYIKQYRDSLRRENEMSIYFEGVDEEEVPGLQSTLSDIKFISRSNPENWRMLDALVEKDTLLSNEDRLAYLKVCEILDLDEREERLQTLPTYRHYREVLYPKLRTVKFDFHLHRKGMVQDTVQTTVLDEEYMAGVQAIRDRDYERAITILRPYGDINSAIAFLAMDYNASALAILETLPATDQVNYMLAVLYSRQGRDKDAVAHYLQSCKQNPSFIHRGNLDPEISSLVKRYGLDKLDREEEDLQY